MADDPPAIPLDAPWIHGSPDCAANADPSFEARRFDRDTYILRQNKCHTFEAPFLYLLFGADRAFLLDTGADPDPGSVAGQPPISAVVDAIVRGRAAAGAAPPAEWIVAHSHGHGDHAAGDAQFAGRPGTVVVGPRRAQVAEFFGLHDWPEGSATLDLGGRRLTALPIPGHDPAHVAVHDEATGFLLTGDSVYPGLLTVRDWAAYRRSVARLAAFAERNPVSFVLGAHVEMRRTPREFYELGARFQPEEHPLPLESRHLFELRDALDAVGGVPRRSIHDDFILVPLP